MLRNRADLPRRYEVAAAIDMQEGIKHPSASRPTLITLHRASRG